jgi:hypothetical protein
MTWRNSDETYKIENYKVESVNKKNIIVDTLQDARINIDVTSYQTTTQEDP